MDHARPDPILVKPFKGFQQGRAGRAPSHENPVRPLDLDLFGRAHRGFQSPILREAFFHHFRHGFGQVFGDVAPGIVFIAVRGHEMRALTRIQARGYAGFRYLIAMVIVDNGWVRQMEFGRILFQSNVFH